MKEKIYRWNKGYNISKEKLWLTKILWAKEIKMKKDMEKDMKEKL